MAINNISHKKKKHKKKNDKQYGFSNLNKKDKKHVIPFYLLCPEKIYVSQREKWEDMYVGICHVLNLKQKNMIRIENWKV